MSWAGPLWLGKIVDPQFCDRILEKNRETALRNSRKITRLLSLAREEAKAPATYYVIDQMSDKLSLLVPSVSSMLKKLRENGFQAVLTHFNSRAIKTDAPALTMQQLLRKVTENER
jgi:tRNA (guanine26-N2/guanine27-N2)-dimethyltransferase